MIIKNVLLALILAKEILHLRSSGAWRQECPTTVSSFQLPVNNPGQALYLYNAHEARWRYAHINLGWNQIQFNLSDFTRRAYGSNYIETLRVTIHANCRIRRIYFSDRLYSEEELPPEFKLFLPIQKQQWPNYAIHHFLRYQCCLNFTYSTSINFNYPKYIIHILYFQLYPTRNL